MRGQESPDSGGPCWRSWKARGPGERPLSGLLHAIRALTCIRAATPRFFGVGAIFQILNLEPPEFSVFVGPEKQLLYACSVWVLRIQIQIRFGSCPW